MKHHVFSLRAAIAAAGMAVLLVGGTTTAAMAAVTSTSAPSAQQATPAAPGAPTGLTATPGNGTAVLSWSPPSSDGGPPIDSYIIQGGTSPSSRDIVDYVFGHTVTISGLNNGTLYYFRVYAQNGYGGVSPSANVQVTPQGPVSPPGPPTGLKTSYGDSFIALSWSAPTSTGGSSITGYHVYLGLSPSLVGARVYTTSVTSIRLTDVQNGSLYYIKVAAFNTAGEGPGTPVAKVMPAPTPWQPPAGPPRPTGLTAHARHGAVVLSWSPPKGGLKDGDGYFIYMSTRSGHEGAKPLIPHLIEFVTSYTVAALKDGTRYYFQVAQLDGNNRVSARSAEVSAVPGVVAGSPPSPTPAPTASVGVPAGPSVGATAQPSPPLPSTEVANASSSLPTGLIVLLVALVLAAAAGGATAVMLLRRRRYDRRHDRRYDPVPAPRRPYDDQSAGQVSRTEEMNGPRYR